MPTSRGYPNQRGLPQAPGLGGAQRFPGAGIGVTGVQEGFDAPQYASSLGMQWRTPTGQALPTDPGALPSFIEKYYGVQPQQFFAATEQERQQMYATKAGAARTYEDMPFQDGQMARPPKTPQEAAWASFAATQVAQQEKAQRQQAAMAILTHQMGMLRKGGAGSLAAFMSPMAGQMAQLEASYEPEVADYSYWLTPGAYGITETEIPEPEEPGPFDQHWDTGPTVGVAAGQEGLPSRFGYPATSGKSYAGASWL